MPDITEMLQNGSSHVWLYLPIAILLGALHGLEPGHSKTMMAAFIIAIRGTIWQAVLLGISAALSHSLIIWLLAGLALYYGNRWSAESIEPYLQIASASLIFLLAVWMFFRTRREVAEANAHHHHRHDHHHGNGHGHHHPHGVEETPVIETAEPNAWAGEPHSHSAPAIVLNAGERLSAGGLIIQPGFSKSTGPSKNVILTDFQSQPKETAASHAAGVLLDTGHGWLNVTLFDESGGTRFRIYPCKSNGQAVPMPKGTEVSIETARLNGTTQKFRFEAREKFWESTTTVPAPHEFLAVLTLGHSDHAHTYRLRFSGQSDGHHAHAAAVVEEVSEDGIEYQDAHERAHAEDIARRFANRSVTTPQIILFGITGGLMPCPAAFTILLVCLQLKRVALGFSIVGAFSFGLALTMVTVGALAAWSVQHAQKRFSGFGDWMRRAPYISCAMLVLLSIYMAWSGWQGLLHPHSH